MSKARRSLGRITVHAEIISLVAVVGSIPKAHTGLPEGALASGA